MEASKDLLLMEEKKPSLFESSLLVCKEEETEVESALRTAKRGKKGDGGGPDQEQGQHSTAAFSSGNSNVLGKVKDFLGAIAEANEKLQLASRENGRSDYDIEVLTGNENEYIELDLLLGLTDLQTPEAVAAAEAALGGSRPPLLPSYAAEIPSSSEEDADEEEALNTDSVHPAGPGRGRKRPNITVLD